MDTQSLPLVPFGKYKGQPITNLMNDTKYLEWCKQQEWFQKFPIIYNICVNQTITTNNSNSKTPEHNKLQNMFLNEQTQLKLLNIVLGLGVKIFNENFNTLILDEDFIKWFGQIQSPQLKRSVKDSRIVFEDKYNWDFILYYTDYQGITLETKTDIDEPSSYFVSKDNIASKQNLYNLLKKHNFRYNNYSEVRRSLETYIVKNNEKQNYSVNIQTFCSSISLCCELKPILSDDYPCVLRKMKTQIDLTINDKNLGTNFKFILVIGSFTSTNTSKEQLIAIFKQSNIKVIFTHELFESSNEYQIENIPEFFTNDDLIDKNKTLTDNLLQTQQKLLQAEEKIKQLQEEIVSLKNQKQSKSIKDYFGKK